MAVAQLVAQQASVAANHLPYARHITAVGDLVGWRFAGVTAADQRGVVREVHRDAVVEDVQGALPEAVVAVRLAIRRESAVELVDLLEAAVLHERRDYLAADPAGAVGDDRLALEMVVHPAVEGRDELPGRLDRWAYGTGEVADRRLDLVATV